jgi:osmotically inducible protein OsmC
MERKASAVWRGNVREGSGTVSTGSGVLKDTPYSFTTRFENEPGTNPEELIAAAHAGCFTMALSAELGRRGMTPTSLETSATLTMERHDAGWTVTRIHLDLVARVPEAGKGAFEEATNVAKTNCPISRLLKADVTLNARLET